jgi:5-(carboxyamino)imidazole ribonucleotide synthase
MKLNKSIGILGGGQLASMLTHSAQKLGYKVHIYSESELDPAAALTNSHTKGSLANLSKIEKWAADLNSVTFESEFTDLKDLKLKGVSPSSNNMAVIRDRLSQKNLLEKFKIPTSPFTQEFSSEFTKPVVFKQRLFGYDGYGTVVCKNIKDYHKFFLKNRNDLGDWIVEDFIPFKKELAFSIARTKKDTFCILPLVETFQKDSKCFWVKGPVEHKKLNSLITKVKKMLSAQKYVGIIAVELFETKSGDLLVNELAPRVHNSAHYSIEGLNLSQFDVHNLAILGEELPTKIKSISAFAMVNLIGSSSRVPKIKPPLRGSLHWYNKTPNKPGRKMGHITVLDKTPGSALRLALFEERRQSL